MKTVQTTIALFIMALLTVSCGGSSSVAGATSETTNGVVVTAVSATGTGVAKASVYIAKSDELRAIKDNDRAPTMLTDVSGLFSIDSLDTVNYTVEVIDSMGNRAMSNIVYNPTSKKHELSGSNVLTLSPTGRLFGKVEKLSSQKVYVQIFGLHRIIVTDSTGKFSFPDLPAGDLRIKVTAEDVVVADDHFEVKPNRLTDVGTYTIGATDSVIVRYILDANGLDTVTIEEVYSKTKEGYHLNFDKRGLTTIPAEIGKLRLVELSLAQNKITSIPDELFNLTQLTYLDLSGNKLTELPSSISRLEQCEILDIEDNELTTLPSSITTMVSIEEINLNNNRLTQLPDYIKEWINAHCPDNSWQWKQKKEPRQ